MLGEPAKKILSGNHDTKRNRAEIGGFIDTARGVGGIKIGEPVRVRYSGELLPVWEIFEASSSAGGSFCKYVEIFNGSATCSLQFEGELVSPNVAESILRDVETVKEAHSKKSVTTQQRTRRPDAERGVTLRLSADRYRRQGATTP